MDYLLIGHAACDLTPDGPRLGGTVSFCALTARALGPKLGIVTSAPDSMAGLMSPLEGIPVHRIPTDLATTFENSYTPAGRVQRIAGRAAPLSLDSIPQPWRKPGIVHLAPIADEVDPALARSFPESLVCVTPQGWMRQWDAQGQVSFKPWDDASWVLPVADAVVLSVEDVLGDEGMIAHLARQTAVLVATRGKEGCTLYCGGEPRHIPAPEIQEVDPTGAGDIFAAAFFTRLNTTRDPIRAACFASALASDSVTRRGLASVPPQEVIHAALSQY